MTTVHDLMSKFTSFNQGHSPGLGKAPHKPILLLAVIKAIENKIITNNKVYITPELVSYFRSYWDKLVSSGHTSNFALPFFHLKNEKSGIWTLKNKPGYDFALTSSNSIRSFKALNEATDYAQLNDRFYELLLNDEYRDIIKKIIIEKYFPNVSLAILNENYNYLDILEKQITNDSPAEYTRRVKEKLAKEEPEEEVYLRGSAFKKQIPRLYDYTCAVTGMRIDASDNISLIDACHIVPFAESYDDTITNGIALCPNMHRAFDRGIIAIDDNFRILVSEHFIENYSSHSIHQFEGKEIKLPEICKYHPSSKNLTMHRERFGFK